MLTIRKADFTDAGNIASLHATSWQNNYRGNFSDSYLDNEAHAERLTFWQQRMGSPADNQIVFLAESSEDLCGFLCLFADEDARRGSFIDNLHVDSRYQGLGIGRRLLHEAGTWLTERHSKSGVYLLVWEANPALKFYEHLGGTKCDLVAMASPDGGASNYYRITWDRPDFISGQSDILSRHE